MVEEMGGRGAFLWLVMRMCECEDTAASISLVVNSFGGVPCNFERLLSDRLYVEDYLYLSALQTYSTETSNLKISSQHESS